MLFGPGCCIEFFIAENILQGDLTVEILSIGSKHGHISLNTFLSFTITVSLRSLQSD